MSTATQAALGGADLARGLYRRMALIRRFEETAYRAYESGDVVGTIHACIGQEGVAVGVMSALASEDLVLTHHRGHGHALAKGVDPERLFAELLGRRTGVSGGKGGSMHATDVEHGFLGSFAVVGGSIPLAVGVALAARRRGVDAVTVSFFGDGAINQGVLYEAFNLARIWDLPVVFVCENNGYAISVPNGYATGGGGIVDRARAFGLRAERVDGQDVGAVRDVTTELAAGARRGTPALIEAVTYRLVGHSRGDPAHGLYRTADEVDKWRERDPLLVHAANAGLADDDCEDMLAEAQRSVQDAFDRARGAPAPDAAAATAEVWG